jgi:hypothetical protein
MAFVWLLRSYDLPSAPRKRSGSISMLDALVSMRNCKTLDLRFRTLLTSESSGAQL